MHHLGLRQFNNTKIKKNFKNFDFSKFDNVLKKYFMKFSDYLANYLYKKN